MLERRRLEDLESRNGTSHNPGSEDEDLLNRFGEIGWQLQLLHFLASLEDPKPLRLSIGPVSPSRIYLFLPRESGGDVGGSPWSGHEDKIKTAAQVVRLKGFANGGCDLKCCFAKGNGCKRDACRGDQANCPERSKDAG